MMNMNAVKRIDPLQAALVKLKDVRRAWAAFKAGGKSSPQPLSTGFKIVTDAAGVSRWLGVYSGTYRDRDGEFFAKEAIDAFIERVDSGATPYPELRVWHVGKGKKGLRIGQTDLIARVGNFVLAAGTFDDTKHAQKARAYYQAHLDETAFSHGFVYPPNEREDGVYRTFDTFEISTLDRGYESFPFTKLVGVKAMDINATKRRRLEAIFGKEDLDKLLDELEETDKELERRGVLHKALEDDGIAELVAVCEQLNMTPSALAAMLSAIIDANEKPDEPDETVPTEAPTPEEEEEAPVEKGWYKPGEFVTAMQKERELIEAVKAEAKKQAGVYTDTFWGSEVYPQPKQKEVETVMDPFFHTRVQVKAAETPRVIVRHKFFGSALEYPITRRKAYGELELSDAIDAMQKALNLPQAVVDQMIRTDGLQKTYDILKASIEAQGGKVEFSLEVKS